WDLVHSGHLLYQGQNVFFTLLLGYLALCGMQWLSKKPVLPFLVLLAFALLTLVVKSDYGVYGYIFILLLYALRRNEVFRPLTAFLLSRHWMVLVSFVPISLYNGKRGFIKSVGLKYAFYLFYPVHLFVIYLIKYQNLIF
ncbi:MAG: TraX protein, partial [Ruminococcus sp.]|nr:TraX protein [Ruminococcus sp.]